MLVITKQRGEALLIGPDVAVVFLGFGTGGGVRLGVAAPRSLRVSPADAAGFVDALPPGADLRPLVLALAERVAHQSSLLAAAAGRKGARS